MVHVDMQGRDEVAKLYRRPDVPDAGLASKLGRVGRKRSCQGRGSNQLLGNIRVSAP